MGVATILKGRSKAAPDALPTAPLRTWTALLANLLNPKAAAVYLTLVPQFLDPGSFTVANVLAFACLHATLTALWLAVSSVALRSLRARALPIPRRAVALVGGGTLIALGVRTLVSSRAVPAT
ncbi:MULTISPECIES: LysE family translocator [Glycomyces]|uniref:LysE family transporter n=2 Tax=Glycomyces TaxID=58113 RepID=A0A9X3SWZ6_9ACTN|nr:LysE family transporter [Glycomyces lechevalierae]MDA1387809.1 LysE family transporter [Glycomyces lechevalierae]MDR7337442.1 threonine/homoserine/homoserine lactone efflux protein [Glycomyces lechevalierae]